MSRISPIWLSTKKMKTKGMTGSKFNGKDEKTSNAWLSNMDANKELLWPILESTYGKDQAQKWWMRWRMFFMACAELFAFNNGQEWYVSHYLFEKNAR